MSSLRKMSDAELSRALGRYQTLERVGQVIGLILVAAGTAVAFIKHDLWLFAGLFFAGVIVMVIVCVVINTKKNALLNLNLGDYFHAELFKALGRPVSVPVMMIDAAYLRSAALVSACWDDCDITNFYEAENNGIRFSTANVVLTNSIEERSGPDNDSWMTKTVTVFRGIVVRCADICDANRDIRILDRYQESPPKGDVSDYSVFAERFRVFTSDGREAAGLVTPELRKLCSELEKAVGGKVCGLALKDGEASLALHTGYQFSNIPPNTDLRDIDGVRRAYVESVGTLKTLLDTIKNGL